MALFRVIRNRFFTNINISRKGVFLMAKKKKTEEITRSRNWGLICYPDTLSDMVIRFLDGTVTYQGDFWKTVLFNHCNANDIAIAMSPVHNQDVADGKPVKAHYHVILSFKNPQRVQTIIDLLQSYFGDPTQKLIQDERDKELKSSINGIAKPMILKDIMKSTRYLAHLDNQEKAQYDRNFIVCNELFPLFKYLQKGALSHTERVKQIIDIIDDKHIRELHELVRLLKADKDEVYFATFKHSYNFFKSYIDSLRFSELSTDESYKLLTKLRQDYPANSDFKIVLDGVIIAQF